MDGNAGHLHSAPSDEGAGPPQAGPRVSQEGDSHEPRRYASLPDTPTSMSASFWLTTAVTPSARIVTP